MLRALSRNAGIDNAINQFVTNSRKEFSKKSVTTENASNKTLLRRSCSLLRILDIKTLTVDFLISLFFLKTLWQKSFAMLKSDYNYLSGSFQFD